MRVTGTCLCCGVTITGSVGTVAQPEPYLHRDFWTGRAIECVAVVADDNPDGMPHDVPTRNS